MAEVVTLRCPTCEAVREGAQVKSIPAGSSEMKTCAKCGALLVAERSRVIQPIARVLARAALYPFRPLTLATSTGVLLVAFGASFLPFGSLIAGGVRFGWLFSVLRAASKGAEDPEIDPTEIESSVFLWIGPFVRSFVAMAVAFGPALAALGVLGESGAVLAGALALAGSIYLPAALIVAAHNPGWFAALNPLPALKLIARIPGSYATACALLFVLAMVSGASVAVARALAVPILSGMAEAVLGFLPLVGAARMLGVLVHECREEL